MADVAAPAAASRPRSLWRDVCTSSAPIAGRWPG